MSITSGGDNDLSVKSLRQARDGMSDNRSVITPEVDGIFKMYMWRSGNNNY